MPLLITETTDENILTQCARLMCDTDPWKILGRDFTTCLNAVHGDYKEIYIATDNNRFIGFAVVQMIGTLKGYIQSICISKEERSKGFGSKLLAFCEEKIFQVSPNVFICVSSFNINAARLYYKTGYEKAGELKDFFIEGHSEILLRKTIGPITGFKPKH